MLSDRQPVLLDAVPVDTPNALLYKQTDTGQYDLMGAEWIVPASDYQEPPALFAEAFNGWFGKRRNGDDHGRPPGYRKNGDSHPLSRMAPLKITGGSEGLHHSAE